MKSIAVCLSPELIHLFDLKGKTVVIVDILRATSCMTTAFAYGLESMRPLADLEECRSMAEHGYIIAAERGGEKVPGFDIGNSPYSYMDPKIKGAKVAVTTTNGTLAIAKSNDADHVLIGSFLNISAVAQKVLELDRDVVIHCAGWKGSVNAEDTLFAGALIELLKDEYTIGTDDASISHSLYKYHKADLLNFVSQSAHAKRLAKFGIIKDIEFCLKHDIYKVVPFLDGDDLVI
jgi:2-phosphosulfolactate phosphatase